MVTGNGRLTKPGDKLFFFRTTKHVPVAELARAAGTTPDQILRYETHQDDVPDEMREKLARALGIRPSALAEG